MSQTFIQKIDEIRKQFTAYNLGRIRHILEQIDHNHRAFFFAIPAMIQEHWQTTELPILQSGPTYKITNDNLRPRHSRAMQHLFPDAQILDDEQERLPIHLLTLMGSMGTLSQSKVSDWDFNLFISKKDFSSDQLQQLHERLQQIEQWAQQSLAIEVHFFISDCEEFQQNDFGNACQENVGSSQAKLFKDEFYRTLIVIAGKPPLWWIMPNNLSDAESAEFKNKLSSEHPDILANYLDLGYVTKPSFGEFFGAALWQMNKSLQYPFKSILKMGLLEAYLISDNQRLISDELKQYVIDSISPPYQIDPYYMMQERITHYYQQQNMTQEVSLLQAAFLLKAGVKATDIDRIYGLGTNARYHKDRQLAGLIGEWQIDPISISEVEQVANQQNYTQDPMQNRFNRFFLQAYQRLSKHRETNAENRLIDEQDMTILGRKLFVYFQKRDGKIYRLPPSILSQDRSNQFTIGCQNRQSKVSSFWRLYDFHVNKDHDATIFTHINPPIQQMRSLLKLLTWMVINQFWTSDSELQYEDELETNDIALICQLLPALYHFFLDTIQSTPSQAQYLAPKHITHIFVLPELHQERSLVVSVELVVLDSWGELTHYALSPIETINMVSKMVRLSETSDDKIQIEVFALDPENKVITNGFLRAIHQAV